MNTNIKKNLPKAFVIILAMLTAASPLAIDVYLPAFTQISQFYEISIDKIEVTLSIYLLGFALGQLLGGPLSDRYGRKILIYVGLFLYIIFSFLISFSATIEEFWVFRLFQAFGGGLAVVNSSAIVRDLYSGKEGAKIFSLISIVMMIAPLLAPVLGSLILSISSWQVIFVFLAFYSLLVLFLIKNFPETSPKIKQKSLFSNYVIIVKNSNALLLIFANGFAISGLFIFLTKANFIYMEYFKQDLFYFTIFFSINVASLMLFSRYNIKLLEKHSTFSLFIKGIVFQLFIAVLLFSFSSYAILPVVVIGFMLYIGSLGFIFGNAASLLLEHFSTMSATAVALNGVIGFMISALIGFLSSYFHDGTLVPIFTLMIGTSFISLLILSILMKRKYI